MSLRRSSSVQSMGVQSLIDPLDVKVADVSSIDFIDESFKKSFESNKRVSIRDSSTTFRFEDLSSWDKFVNNVSGNKSINDPEIHIVWKPFIPNQNRDWKLNVTLIWDGDEEPLQAAMIPLHLHAHIILYPNHSAPISKRNKLPWHIDFKVDDTEVREKMEIADVWIQLKGSVGKTAGYGGKREAKVISLVPIGEHFNGITISRPYQMKDPLIITGYQLRIGTNQDKKKLLMLQEYGVDIHGLSLCSALNKILRQITTEEIKKKDNDDVREMILHRINRQISG